MSGNRWSSVRIIIGGGIIALVAVALGLIVWDVPYWFIYVVSVLFVFPSAIIHSRRIYLYIALAFIVTHLGVDIYTGGRSFLLGSDAVQWLSIIAAGEVIHQISSQRRRSDKLSQQRIQELEVMNETLTSISSELELNNLLQTITERAVKLLNVTLGELLLFDKETGEMEIVAQFPLDSNQIGFKMKPGEGTMGRVAVTKKSLIVNDYKAFVNSLPDKVTTGVEATLDVPLLKGDEFIGVLGVARHSKSNKFTHDDQRLLTVLASQVTVAIENARLYKNVQHLAFTDALTGINNRRRLFELLDEEYRRSIRYQRPLSLMLVDIDHFKKINDTYGHAAGDEVLRWFAKQCSASIRQKLDLIGRFGGEEFAFIYPEADLASAMGAAKRLHTHITGLLIPFNELELKITFSAGVASLPQGEEIGFEQLIERADKALYFAKESRDCMAYWDAQAAAPRHIH
ncbi:MAG: sensor domain-containing diguanylate cyclase [Chloroflexota bacterium]